MEKKIVYILESDGIKRVFMHPQNLYDALDAVLSNATFKDFNLFNYKVYCEVMTQQKINELPDLSGF